jgi:hypothetical protein
MSSPIGGLRRDSKVIHPNRMLVQAHVVVVPCWTIEPIGASDRDLAFAAIVEPGVTPIPWTVEH